MTRRLTKKVRDLTFRDFGRHVAVEGESFDRFGLPLTAAIHRGRLRGVWPQWDSGVIDTVRLSLSPNANYTMGKSSSVDVMVDPDDEITVLVPDAEIILLGAIE